MLYYIMVMEKNAVWVGGKWLPYRQAGTEHLFTVHSVFNRVVNVTAGRGLLSIAAGDIGRSSAFLSLPEKELDLGVAPGDQCVLRGGCLNLTQHTINFNNTSLWKGPIHKGYQHSRIKKENIAAFKAVLDRKAAPESAWRVVNSDTESRFSGLKAILNLKKDPFLAQNLIGLGQGLTPAGDDMLVGFLAIANHSCAGSFAAKCAGSFAARSENRVFTDILHKIVADSLHNTVDISAQALDNALDCDYHEFVQNCVKDLYEGGMEEVYISAASLISIGATSGSDIACGMYFGMIGGAHAN